MALKVFARQAAEPDLDHLDLDLPSVESAIDELRARVADVTMATFEDLTAHCSRPVEVAAYFLALLELARWGLITVSQEDWLSEIVVSDRGAAASGFNSEWAS
jgi:chromatin segregation and condensation protein Rec8/ScpA/Scc1 (kleisin family)